MRGMMFLIIFWVAVALILYTYIGYLAFLKVIALFCKKSIQALPYTPHITLLISAYNEADVIENKIKNTLSLNYPKDKLEIIIVSDASFDDTDRIVLDYANKGIKLKRFEGRIGKTACLNKVLPSVQGEIVVFSDANSHYHENAILNIAMNFSDRDVGCVTGWTRYTSKEGDQDVGSIGLYARIEKSIKIAETSLGSCIGADGAIFAIRKGCYSQLNDYDINDFVIPLNVVSKGYRTVFDENVYCIEASAEDLLGEFKRQVRITNRTIRALWNNRHLFSMPRYKFFSIQLISHKLFKFMSPLFIIVVTASNIASISHGFFYQVVLTFQICVYIFATFPESLFKKNTIVQKLHSFLKTFLYINIAMGKGWFTYMKGEDFVTWKSSR